MNTIRLWNVYAWRKKKMITDEYNFETLYHGGIQARLAFGDYELSIVKGKYTYGGDKDMFEIGVFKEGIMTEMPGITNPGDTVKGYLTSDQVKVIIKKMQVATGYQPMEMEHVQD